MANPNDERPAVLSNGHDRPSDAAPGSDLGALAIEEWLITHLAAVLEVSPDEISVSEPFASYGLDSVQAVGLVGDLEDGMGCELPATLTWDYPNIRALTRYLAEHANPAATPL